jgi:hypothetical protein
VGAWIIIYADISFIVARLIRLKSFIGGSILLIFLCLYYMFHSLHHLVGSMADAAKYVSPYATGLVGFAGGLITATFGKTATPKTE